MPGTLDASEPEREGGPHEEGGCRAERASRWAGWAEGPDEVDGLARRDSRCAHRCCQRISRAEEASDMESAVSETYTSDAGAAARAAPPGSKLFS